MGIEDRPAVGALERHGDIHAIGSESETLAVVYVTYVKQDLVPSPRQAHEPQDGSWQVMSRFRDPQGERRPDRRHDMVAPHRNDDSIEHQRAEPSAQ